MALQSRLCRVQGRRLRPESYEPYWPEALRYPRHRAAD